MAPEVSELDRRASEVVLPEHEAKIIAANARNAPKRVRIRLHDEYNEARRQYVQDQDDDEGDGLDALKSDELDALADEHGVDLTDANRKTEKVERLRAAGVEAD